MHPWNLIIRGKTAKEETISCFMCLHGIPTEKIREHMTKEHSAKCPIENLVKMCQEAEKIKERDRISEIIKEENNRRGKEEELMKTEIKGWAGLFVGKKTRESAERDTEIINCFLCQETWTDSNKNQLEKHLLTCHRLIFGAKEIIYRGSDNWEDISKEETYV